MRSKSQIYPSSETSYSSNATIIPSSLIAIRRSTFTQYSSKFRLRLSFWAKTYLTIFSTSMLSSHWMCRYRWSYSALIFILFLSVVYVISAKLLRKNGSFLSIKVRAASSRLACRFLPELISTNDSFLWLWGDLSKPGKLVLLDCLLIQDAIRSA